MGGLVVGRAGGVHFLCHLVMARLAHAIVYALGLPVFRTIVWTIGFIAQAVLVLAIFRLA